MRRKGPTKTNPNSINNELTTKLKNKCVVERKNLYVGQKKARLPLENEIVPSAKNGFITTYL